MKKLTVINDHEVEQVEATVEATVETQETPTETVSGPHARARAGTLTDEERSYYASIGVNL